MVIFESCPILLSKFIFRFDIDWKYIVDDKGLFISEHFMTRYSINTFYCLTLIDITSASCEAPFANFQIECVSIMIQYNLSIS